jgi:hypothetical protein
LDPSVREQLRKYPNVVGVGHGFKKSKGLRTGTIAAIAIVSKKVSPQDLPLKDRIPPVIGRYITDVQEFDIQIQQDTGFYRPAPGGCSIGHYRITAGTLGAVVEYLGKVGILSNNHILANSNDASIGDRILQPGDYDGGEFPIAKLTEYVPIQIKDGGGFPIPPIDCPIADFFVVSANFAARIANSGVRVKAYRVQDENPVNYVDAAFAEEWEGGLLDPKILEIGDVDPLPLEPSLGMRVQKRGRTTQRTIGTITMVDVDVEVQGYGGGSAIAIFVDQIVIEADNNESFSEGGDSGSLILNMNANPVGLLFAGGTDNAGNKITIGNKIHNVLEAFPGMRFL